VSLTEYDRDLLERCLAKKNGAWEDFVDRFSSLAIRVIGQAAHACEIELEPTDVEDLVAEVFMKLVMDDYALMRKFRGKSSLTTFLTVIVRRLVTRMLLQDHARPGHLEERKLETRDSPELPLKSLRRDDWLKMMETLDEQERSVVQLFHLESKSYEQIQQLTGIPLNNIGPLLSQARKKMKNAKPNPLSS
jgi:RNA polymerase sigma-70 factor (ECF subfamily)